MPHSSPGIIIIIIFFSEFTCIIQYFNFIKETQLLAPNRRTQTYLESIIYLENNFKKHNTKYKNISILVAECQTTTVVPFELGFSVNFECFNFKIELRF